MGHDYAETTCAVVVVMSEEMIETVEHYKNSCKNMGTSQESILLNAGCNQPSAMFKTGRQSVPKDTTLASKANQEHKAVRNANTNPNKSRVSSSNSQMQQSGATDNPLIAVAPTLVIEMPSGNTNQGDHQPKQSADNNITIT